MSFLSPAFLLGLPLVAVPVLIHFFSRKQRAPIRWGAMDFLLASATPRRRFLRLRDLLLLLLRIAVVLAIIGALARPIISSNLIGASGPRDVILIVDNSMSTARRAGSESVFDLEMAEADKIIGQLKPVDSLRILLTSPQPEWLGDNAAAGESGGLRELTGRLHDVKPNDGSADVLTSMQTALQAGRAGNDATRFITLITDGQAHGWRGETPGVWASLHALAKKEPLMPVIHVIVPNGIPAGSANLAVEKVTAERSVVGVGQPVTLTASIKNTGSIPSAATSLAWSTREESLGLSTVPALAPGAGTTINLSQPFATAGMIEVGCRLAAQDDLAPDNSAHFLLDVTKSVPILLVEGEPQSDPSQSDSRYFLAALGYGGDAQETAMAASIFRPRLINYEHLRDEELSGYQSIVLADVPRLSAEVTQKLAHYVNSGGGLWIALGEQTDVAAFNQMFFEQGGGLSTFPLRQPVGDADDHEKFTALTPPVAGHPATALLADTHRLDIDRVRIYRRHQFDVGAGTSSSVLLRAEGGAPIAVERDLGRGRVIVLAIPLGVAWSNLPLCHSYVVMVREWLWYLTEPGLVKRNLQAGEVLQITQPIESSPGSASLQMPSGRLAQLFGQEEDGRMVFRYGKTQFPGEYSFTAAGAKGARPENFLVGRDPEESNLTPLTADQMTSIGNEGGLEFNGDPLFQPAAQKIAAPPKALAMWLLLALVGLMAAEIVVAFWMARRRRAAMPGVVMEAGYRV